jgi:hypothetical protein
MNLEPEPGAESENNVIATKLAQTIESLNLSINQSELEEFVHIDDKSNEDVEELLESMKINEVGLDEDSDVNQLEQIVESQDRVEFHGFESLYKQIFDISCSALTFKQKPKKHSTISKNRLKSSKPRSKQSSSKPDTKKTKTCAK